MNGIPISPPGLKWVRGPASLKDGYVCIDAERAEPYFIAPESAAAVLEDLAGVMVPREAVQFAERFGLLRHGSGSASLREPFSEWREAGAALRAVLYLYSALLRSTEWADGEELRQRVEDLR
ncbi:MAG: hypothetical protein ABSC36_03300, partial [Gaiellaceae bacterium]